MNRLQYRVYYKFLGRSRAAPFNEQKSPDDIEFALSRVKPELETFLDDESATISVQPELPSAIIVMLETSRPEEAAIHALKRCLSGLDLLGDRLP